MLVGAVVRRFAVASVTVAAVVVGGITIEASPADAAGFTCSSASPVYTVRPGDGWYVIAARVGVSAASLLDANGAGVDASLVPGDQLCLPGGADLRAACVASHVVARGEGWLSIADRAGVPVTDLLAINGAALDRLLHPGDVVCLPAGARASAQPATGGSARAAATASGATYTVVRGDSWFDIAARSGVSLRQLLAANDARADGRLWPGDVVRLPAGASAPAATAAPNRPVAFGALPVQGPCWYFDTWHAPRGGGRRHVGVDIITAPGRYVYAVADGRLTGRSWDQPDRLAGNAWHLTADDGTRYFYAHLRDFAPDLKVGSTVEAGQIIGWVGDTGNASTAHLHFEIHPGGGAPVNPFPIVRAAGGCNRGTPYTQPSGWTPDTQR